MSIPANILYVGDLWSGSTALHRLDALKELRTCTAIDSTPVINSSLSKWIYLAGIKTGYRFDMAGVNKAIISAVRDDEYGIFWVDKGLNISPHTVKEIKKSNPSLKTVFYSPDDMSNKANQSVAYLQSLPLYDLHVTTKSYNVAELKTKGAKDVLFVGNGYDPAIHHPTDLSSDETKKWGSDIGFIGSWERDRHQQILQLAANNLNVKVVGEGWAPYSNQNLMMKVVPENAWGHEYAKVICATRINLCFLKKGNRDLQTTRSVEIPACGAFMLAERTHEHLELFEEDKEAVFFSTNEELVDKARFYLRNEELRKTIAEAGRQRCIHSGYSNKGRLSKVLEHLQR